MVVTASCESCEVEIMMFEGVEVMLGCWLAALSGLLWHIVKRLDKDKAEAIARAEGLKTDIGGAFQNLVNALDFEIPSIDSMKEIIEDSIGGFMGQMHVPTGQDMIMGALSQLIISKVAPKLPPEAQQMVGDILPPPIQPQDGLGGPE